MIHAATHVHFQIAEYFLKQSIPTFVDKPLADSAQQVEQLYEIAAIANQPLYVALIADTFRSTTTICQTYKKAMSLI